MRNINCRHNDDRAWCNNANVPRSLFGFGARCCVEDLPLNPVKCEYKIEFEKPEPPPNPPPAFVNPVVCGR